MLLDLDLDSKWKSYSILGGIFKILGLHCPLLETFQMGYSDRQSATRIEVQTFTKGCPNLKKLSLDISCTKKTCHKLFYNLGTYNPALEELYLWGNSIRYDFEAYHRNTELNRQQSQSLQCLSGMISKLTIGTLN